MSRPRRNGNRKGRAFAFNAVNRDVAPVQAHKVAHERQTDASAFMAACTGALDAVKALEHAR